MQKFEDDLMNLNDLRSLYRAMICNGVKEIKLTKLGLEMEVTAMALLQNQDDLKDKVKYEANSYCVFVIAKICKAVTVKCSVSYGSEEYDALKENGFALPEKEQE